MTNEATFKREMTPLENIKDNYEKIVLTLDKFSVGNYRSEERRVGKECM